ncbi:MAG: COX15/CtaA family protein [Acidobacteriota bacterium]|jgi:heme A synthase
MNRFSKYAWLVVGYNLLVIMWGAYVRASGSGAGCGSHWPLCNGEVVPRTPTMATIVEFSHRLTSGLALLMVIGLVIYAWRAYEKRHHVRFLAALSLFFMLTEALVGAGLVLFEYVALNKSVARAWWMGAHLLNTFILLACLTVTAWVATTGERLKLAGQGRLRLLCLLTILATLLVGVSGAISALGATLFPVTSVAEGLREDLSPTAHILVRLRIYHPIIAIVVSTLLVVTAVAVRLWRPGRWTLNFSRYLIALVTIQFALGLVNLLLHAPIPLQIIHLLLSDLIWMALILLIWSGMSTKWPERLVPAS